MNQSKSERRAETIKKLTPKQKKFIKYYLNSFNAKQSAIFSGYETIYSFSQSYKILRIPAVKEEIKKTILNNKDFFILGEELKAKIKKRASNKLYKIKNIYINKNNRFYYNNYTFEAHKHNLNDNFFYRLEKNGEAQSEILKNKAYNYYYNFLNMQISQTEKFYNENKKFFENNYFVFSANENKKILNNLIMLNKKKLKIINQIDKILKEF